MTGPWCAIGIDLGGTHTRVGLVDASGTLLNMRRGPTLRSVPDLVDWIGASVSALAAGGEADAIGLAVPGALSPDRSMILRAVNLRFLENVPLRDRLAERLGRRVVLDTDVGAAAWGEYARCPVRPARFVFLAIGTGIGAAAILDGRPVRHTHGGAGHIGQMVVDSSPDAPRGPCGTRGTLEARVSGPALERAAQAAGLPTNLSELQRRCQRGDTAAGRVVDQAARFLAIGLVNVACLYAPNEIVIGGGAAGALPEVVERAAKAVRDLGGDLVPAHLHIRPAALGDDAGMIGAALLARATLSGADDVGG